MRSVLVLLAWCLVAGGVPTGAQGLGDGGDPSAQIAPTTVAKIAPRRSADVPRFDRAVLVAVVAPPVTLVPPPRTLLAGERFASAQLVTPLVRARSSRGPPIG